MAGDLRDVVAAMKIGVWSSGSAIMPEHRQARPLLDNVNIEPVSLMPEMARIATEMVHDVLNAFVERDAEAAVRVVERDRAVDDFYNSISGPADLHDGIPATSASPPPPVHRQECRAGRRPCSQHRRDYMPRRNSILPTARAAPALGRATMIPKRLLLSRTTAHGRARRVPFRQRYAVTRTGDGEEA
jgi:hypothetical protein